MARRLALGLFLLLIVFLAVSAGQTAKADRLSDLRAKISAAEAREAELSAEIGSIEGRIRELEAQVGGVSSRLDALEHDLVLQQERLNTINRLFRHQTEHLDFLRGQYSLNVDRLSKRMIEMYETGEPTTLDILLSTENLGEFLDHVDYVRDLGDQDARISLQVGEARDRVDEARERTKVTRAKVQTVTRTIAARTAQVREVKEELLITQKGLSQAKGVKRRRLASVEEQKRDYLHEVAGILASNAQVTATIQASGSSSYDSSPSASGLIWPVSGPVVSGFGMRWGRMHTGIDIGVGYGTPIHASASGTVIFAGWMGGYGNFVIVDHGGGLSTAYAHQSSIAVGGGSVVQGQVLGYVGCTGHCFGPHLHFEVRINGSPVDPLGYL